MSLLSLAKRLLSGAVRRAPLLAGCMSAHAVPPEVVHPGWTIVNLRPDASFKPMVTGLGFLSDGRLVVSHWGGTNAGMVQPQFKGAVYIVNGVLGDAPAPKVTTFAQGLEDPLGLLVKDDRIYVSGGEKLIELPDANGDGTAEAARVICKIPGTHYRHEFLFGLVFKDGKFWMNPSSAKPLLADGILDYTQKNPNRGTVMSVDPTTGAYEVFAMGLREPNGIGLGPEGEMFVPDVQGNWLPANKLIHVRKGKFYGFKHDPPETWDNMVPSPPAVYLPQGEVARAPGNPLYVPSGPYAGQMLMGDAVAGGIRRLFLEKVGADYQGAVFHFAGGFEGGPNRIAWGPDGHLYVGSCGQGAPSWAYKQDFGLQKMKPNGKDVFEMLAVRSRQGGMEIEFTHEVNAAALDKAGYTVRTWHYVSTSAYGGGAVGTKTLPVGSVQASPDRKSVFLAVPGLEAGKVVYISLNAAVASSAGLAPWTKEAWYTLNAISPNQPFAAPPTALPGADGAVQDGRMDIRAVAGRLDLLSRLGGILSVEVRDVRGMRVADVPGEGRRQLRIPTAAWGPGVYHLSVRAEGGTAHRKLAVP